MELKERYLRNPLCAGRVIDGEAFVVTPGDNKLHRLNTTATLIWDCCDTEPQSLESIAAMLAKSFRVDKKTALNDAKTCLTDFIERKIIVGEQNSN